MPATVVMPKGTPRTKRHLVRAGKLIRLRVTALDHAEPLGTIATLIGRNGGNILDASHDRVFDRFQLGTHPSGASACNRFRAWR